MTDVNLPPAEVEWLAERGRLQAQAIEVLTRAVRLTRPGPNGGPADFAGFLAEVLASVAANVGSVWRVTAGRSGSWEADLVDQLIAGTVGYNEEHLLAHRTEPVRVPLNVALLVEDLGSTVEPPVLPLDQALDALWIAAEDQADTAELSDDEAEAAWQALETAEADLTARYRAAYTAYAHAFTAAVTEAARAIEGLTVPVEVVTNADPEAWSNPIDLDGDPLVWKLWDTAQQQLGLPRP